MEKVIYLVSAGDGGGSVDLGSRRRKELADRLRAVGGSSIRCNVADADVAAAAPLRMAMSPEPAAALVSVWVDSAIDHLRRPVDEVVSAAAPGASVSAYLVTESVPLPLEPETTAGGQRVPGMAQVAFLRRPAELAVPEWLDRWLNHHTQVALATQDTCSYVQNVVARVLTEGATPWDAIVEECFPAAAMTDPHVFFDAVGDDDRLADHQRTMFESVQRFVDLSMIDVLPTSRYDL